MNINSTLFLCNNVDLDPNYNFTIDFDSLEAQENYFDSKVANVLAHTDDYSYIRDNQTLKVYVNVDDIVNVNYLFYNNGKKRYYAFILKKDYISPTCTSITFKIDVMQSFMFDYEIDECYIDREHQDRFNESLKPVYNTKVENLEIGSDYELKKSTKLLNEDYQHNEQTIWYYIYAKEPLGQLLPLYGGSLEDDTFPTEIRSQNASLGVSTGYYVYLLSQILPVDYAFAENDNKSVYMGIVAPLLENEKVVKIVASRYIPKNIKWDADNSKFVIESNIETTGGVHCRLAWTGTKTEEKYYNMLIKISEIVGYNYGREFEIDDILPSPILSIENKKSIDYETKLYTSPYSILRLNIFNKFTNLARENFSNGLRFNVSQGLVNATQLNVLPLDYLCNQNEEQGTNRGNYFNNNVGNIDNQINLRTDAWQQYQANNSASINGNMVLAGVGVVAGAILGFFTGGLGWAIAGSSAISLGTQIGADIIKKQDIKNTPDEVQASNDSFTPILYNDMLVNIEFAEIKEEYKNAIFNYFYRYGYKCSDFKKPNTRSRYYFNYIKTIGANIKTNISADYKNEIVDIYNNGITIWHYRDNTTFKGINNFDYENVEIKLIGGNNG